MGLVLFPQLLNVLRQESYLVTSLGRYAYSVEGGEVSLTLKPIGNLLQLFKQKVMKAGIKTEGQRRGV